MKDFIKTEISAGVTLITVPATRFKTNETAVSFITKLSEETASENALLIYLLSHCSKEYPDMRSLNKRLALLYGASIRASANKTGESQVLSLFLSSLDDRFALDGDKISIQSAKLLLSLIFSPKLDENGMFFEEDIEREKRLLIEKLESENSDKRAYALRRLEEEMFKGEAYSLNPLGMAERIRALTPEDIKRAYDELIKSANIVITTVGAAESSELADTIKNSFENIERAPLRITKPALVPSAKEVKTVEERQAVKQGKLVLGFRVNLKPESDKTDAMRIFCDVFGGGPYSKLFMNVREKLSLCYYCSARYNKRNSSIVIQCGCEEENMDKAVKEILQQIENIKNGDFESEFKSSVSSLCDSVKSVYDDSAYLLGWYIVQITDGTLLSPSQVIDSYNKVSFDEAKPLASLLSLDTVYKLMGEKEA